jgi:hypothetical protein
MNTKQANRKNNIKTARIVNSWNFPEGRLMKAVAVRLHDGGLRGRALEEKFGKLIPQWKSYFRKPISNNAVAQRADKARRYRNEAPEKNPTIYCYWGVAGRIVRSGKKIGKRQVRQIVSRPKNGVAR